MEEKKYPVELEDKIKEIQTGTTNYAYVNARIFDPIGHQAEDDYISMTEWSNGFGVDIEIYDQTNKKENNFRLTYGELEGLIELYKILTNN